MFYSLKEFFPSVVQKERRADIRTCTPPSKPGIPPCMSPHRSILPKSDSPPDTHYHWVQPPRPSLPLLKFVWQYGCSYHGHKRSKLLKNSELQACQVGTSMCQRPLIPTTRSNYPVHRYPNVVRPPRTAVKSRCQPLRPQTLRLSTVNNPPDPPICVN